MTTLLAQPRLRLALRLARPCSGPKPRADGGASWSPPAPRCAGACCPTASSTSSSVLGRGSNGGLSRLERPAGGGAPGVARVLRRDPSGDDRDAGAPGAGARDRHALAAAGRRAPARARSSPTPTRAASSSTTSPWGHPGARALEPVVRLAAAQPPLPAPSPRRPRRLPGPVPARARAAAAELAALRELCERRARRFTAAYNGALLAIESSATPVPDAVGTPAPELTVVAYPAELAPDFERRGVALVGALVRSEEQTTGSPPRCAAGAPADPPSS